MSGVDIFLKYAYAPNLRGFCGPRDVEIIQEGLLSDNAAKITEIDRGLRAFTGALPYLQLIAGANYIRDPFNERVVEAYWIGNDLLNNVSAAKLYDHLRGRFRSRVNPDTLNLITIHAPSGAKPHHSFHVFDAFLKSGGLSRLGVSSLPEAVLAHIDECRVGWGTFENYTDSSKSQIAVRYEPIQSQNSKITVPAMPDLPASRPAPGCGRREMQNGNSKLKILENNIEGRKLFLDLIPGDIVSFHWSRICDKISKSQARRLKFWTKYHLDLMHATGNTRIVGAD